MDGRYSARRFGLVYRMLRGITVPETSTNSRTTPRPTVCAGASFAAAVSADSWASILTGLTYRKKNAHA